MMFFNNNSVSDRRRLPLFYNRICPSLILAVLILPVSLYCNQYAAIRMNEISGAENCFADAFCIAGGNTVFLYANWFMMLCVFLHTAQFDFRPVSLLRFQNRNQVFHQQIKRVLVFSALFTVYILGVTAVLGKMFTSTLLNWNEYGSWFFFENQSVTEESVFHIVLVFTVNQFFSIATTGVLALVLKWLSGSNLLAILVITFVYMLDTGSLVQAFFYYDRFSLWIKQWSVYPFIEMILLLQALILLAVVTVGSLLVKRKDMLHG